MTYYYCYYYNFPHFKQQLKTIPSLYWEGTPGLLFYFSKEHRRPAAASQLYPLAPPHLDARKGPQLWQKGLSPSNEWTSRVHPLLNQRSRRAQHPDAVVTPSLRVSIVSPCALACSWCGVEARSVHTPPPPIPNFVLCLRGFVPCAGPPLVPSGASAGTHSMGKKKTIF